MAPHMAKLPDLQATLGVTLFWLVAPRFIDPAAIVGRGRRAEG